jgi:electron transport complex protein RnfE
MGEVMTERPTVTTKTRLWTEFAKGILRENPILVIMLGLCPTLAVSTSATNAVGMGAAFSFVVICSNLVVSLTRRFVPHQIRIPVFITIISTFVTIVDYTLRAYSATLSRALGVFVPLIVVNCIVMGRAEAFASRNGVFRSLLDAVGMAVGFTVGITAIGSVREILGNGTLFGALILPQPYQPILLMVLPPGAFLVMGFLQALLNRIQKRG